MGRNIGKNISKILNSNYSQNFIDHTKQSATDALKTASKRTIRNTAEATGDLVGYEMANKITRVLKIWSQNNSEENIKHAREIHRERYTSPQRQKII